MNRYDPTNSKGLAVLDGVITYELGWILRTIDKVDVGIDANIEQVVDGNPTARYISVQLKTGYGNVSEDRNGNFTYYIDLPHYEYWLSSSIPVIIVLCDPDKKVLYWEVVKLSNIERTPTKHKITIRRSHTLTQDSIEEFNCLIDTYQSEFQLPELDSELASSEEYWSDLLAACSETLSDSNKLFNRLDEKYKGGIAQMQTLTERNPQDLTKPEINKQLKIVSKKFKLAIDVCKTQFQKQIPIIVETHIEAIRLIENAIITHTLQDKDIIMALNTALQKEISTINDTIDTFKEGVSVYSHRNSPDMDLRRSEHSFASVLEDYIANVTILADYIQMLISKLNETSY